jgi:hypothetical protein
MGFLYFRCVCPVPCSTPTNELNFLNQVDLEEIVSNLSQEICVVCRFFFKLDYIVTATARILPSGHALWNGKCGLCI